MNTQQIKYFLTVARCLNFTEAAAQLYIAQPTLSRQISSLEHELNMQLFIRDKKGIRLTPAGKYLFEQFSVMYEQFLKVITIAADKNKGYSKKIRIGILDGHIINSFLPDVLRQCSEKHPEMKVELTRGSFRSLTNQLYDQALDFAITLYFDIAVKEKLRFQIISATMDCIAVHRSHKHSGLTETNLKNFEDNAFILLSSEDSAISASKIIELCSKEGFYPKILFAQNLETVMLMVEAGQGVAMLNNFNSLYSNPNVSLIPYGCFKETSLVLAWHQENENPAISLFLEYMRPHFQQTL